MSSNFVHLGIHTEYSLKDSIIRIDPLMKALKNKGMFAFGIADIGNMFATVRLYQAAMKKGIKPIIGSEFLVQAENGMIGKMSLYCQNPEGYKNLMTMTSRSYDEAKRTPDNVPIIPIEWLSEYSQGIIALTGAREGILGKVLIAGSEQLADEHTEYLKSIFGDRLYLEIQRAGHPDDNLNVRRTARMSMRHKLPVVATNGVRFLEKIESKSHDIRVAISNKTTVSDFKNNYQHAYSEEQYLKTPEEMEELFKDIPSAISNTYQIAKRCSIDITLGENYLPTFPVPEGMTEADFIQHASREGLDERLVELYGPEKSQDPEVRKPYVERLEFELNVINNMKFPGYFLIVADFIQWSKNNDIPVGPGRGSGAGSLVAYSLKITDLDPLEYDLLFERFLNPERVSMPDFDIDFCMDGRERVIQYVADKYGHKAVSQIITFGTMAAKGVVRDVARSLGYSYGVGNKIAKLIPETPGTTLTKCLAEISELKLLYEIDSEVKIVCDHALKLEGITRQVGKHAGGVLIAPHLLTDFTPTYCEPDGSGLVSQYDKSDVEYAGLVKFDFLGLRTLTVIKMAVDSINKRRQENGLEKIKIERIPLVDEKTFRLLQDSETTAVFQLESRGMKNLINGMKPSTFEELIALVALFRPGPMEAGMVDSFVNRKHGREAIDFIHPLLEPVLSTTYGVIVYQEQVMQIAQVLSGFSLGGADMLRRAMGKKKPEEMAKVRGDFVKGALKTNGIPEAESGAIFDLIEKFAGYGFNKSHSAAYALVAYQTAWLKAHYPADFMAAVLSSDMEKMEKVVAFKYESTQMGLNVIPPHINHSQQHFVANEAGEIVYGMRAINGVGTVISDILKERDANGPFTDLLNFCIRCNPTKRILEACILSGALDGLGPNRASLMHSFAKAQSMAKKIKQKKNEMQVDLFGDIMEEVNNPLNKGFSLETIAPWSDKQRLLGEKQTVGLYLTGHPMDEYEAELRNVVPLKLADLLENEVEDGDAEQAKKFKSKSVQIAGQVLNYQLKESRDGPMCIFDIDDKTRRVQVVVRAQTYGESQSFLTEDNIVVIHGRLAKDFKTGAYKIFANKVESIEMVRSQQVAYMKVSIDKAKATPELVEKFKAIVKDQEEGYCPIRVNLIDGDNSRELPISSQPIIVNDSVVIKINALLGEGAAKIIYKNDAEIKEMTVAMNMEEGNRTRNMRHSRIATLIDQAKMAMG